jgi:hypothetical protein
VFAWFKQLRLVDANPFANVSQPEMDRREVKNVRQEDETEFLGWLEGRYPGRRTPHLFFAVKALTGCRLEDICGHSVASIYYVRGGRCPWPTRRKKRSERYAILPEDFCKELLAYRGEDYLWERDPSELRVHVKSAPRHCVLDDFCLHRLAG